MFRSYPVDASFQMLASLLTDKEVFRWDMSSKTACGVYVYIVGVAAYDTLRDLGVSAPKPLLEECRNR